LLQHNRSGRLFVPRVRGDSRCDQCIENIRLGSGRKDVVAFGGEGFEYLDDMVGRFARAVDDFRKAAPDLAMVVDAREAEILVRKVTKLFYCFGNLDSTVFDLAQQFF
jgi:hypothetical protein